MPWPAEGLFAGRRLLIFDLDGTVADTNPVHAATFQQVFDRYGVTIDYRTIAGMRMAESIDRLAADHGLCLSADERAELIAAKRRATAACLPDLQPLPGARAFLERVRGGPRLAMVTSGMRGRVHDTLARLGLAGWFDPLIVGDDLRHAKPHPEGYSRALTLTDTSAAEALVFEDAAPGIAAAQAAGIDVVMVGDTPLPDRRLWRWSELTALVR